MIYYNEDSRLNINARYWYPLSLERVMAFKKHNLYDSYLYLLSSHYFQKSRIIDKKGNHMTNYHGSCHCGAIRFSFESEPITKGIRCNCSICARKGAMMTPFVIAPDKFVINAEEGALGLYQFGTKTAKHYFCTRCGIYPFHETSRIPDHFRVNLGCIDGVDPFSLDADVFDGKHLL